MKKIDNSAISKYSSFEKIKLKNRSWPTNQITNAPIWCSVDLRDGNQALIEPMGIEKKLRFFAMLIELGFKEIEIDSLNFLKTISTKEKKEFLINIEKN